MRLVAVKQRTSFQTQLPKLPLKATMSSLSFSHLAMDVSPPPTTTIAARLDQMKRTYLTHSVLKSVLTFSIATLATFVDPINDLLGNVSYLVVSPLCLFLFSFVNPFNVQLRTDKIRMESQ